MKISQYYYIILLIIGVSCTNTANNKILFPTDNFTTIKGKQILPDLFIAQPLNMLLINNNLLLIDIYDGFEVTLINTKNKISERIAPKGEGPHEFLDIRNISFNSRDNTLCVFDGMTRFCSFYKVMNNEILLNEYNFIGKVRFDNNYPYDIIPFDNKFITNGCFDQYQFALLDKKGNNISDFGIYPSNKNGIEINGCFFLKNQTIITASPNQEYFAAAGVFHDQIVFYKNYDNLTKTKEYFSIDSKINTDLIKEGEAIQYSSSETPETTRTYRVLYPTNSYLYALYWGIQNKDIDNKNICYILKFDWNGNLKEGFKIEQRLKTFAIDEDKNCIYGITYSEEDESLLLQYDM